MRSCGRLRAAWLTSVPSGGLSSSASDINEAGQVVGRSATASGDEHAFLWTAAGGMVDLGTLGGAGSRSQAEGINDAGQVVGLFTDGDDRAFYWTAEDGMVELPTLTGFESGARAINNTGQLAGYGDIETGDAHAVIWSRTLNPPTPEEQIESLDAAIQELVAAGSLKPGQARGLSRLPGKCPAQPRQWPPRFRMLPTRRFPGGSDPEGPRWCAHVCRGRGPHRRCDDYSNRSRLLTGKIQGRSLGVACLGHTAPDTQVLEGCSMRTRRIVGCVAVITSLLIAGDTVHAQSFAWVRSGGGVDVDEARAVAVDADGNSYVTGIFSKSLACFWCGQPAIFGAGQPNATTLLPVDGTQDIFVAKYDSAGVLQWARRAGGGGPDEAWGIAVDGAGNSYITGFTGVADFGDGVTLVPAGAFVAKYDPDGHALWATSIDPAGVGFAIAVDPAGATYVTGHAPDPIVFGSVVTLWKVNAGGTQQWRRQATGNYMGGGWSIAVDADGNSHVTGSVAGGTALFGAGGPIQIPLTDTSGGGQMFVAKYDSSGSLTWARQSADLLGLAYGTGISIDSAGNSLVVGVGTTILGRGEPTETAAGGTFIAKYGSLGDLIWAKSIAGNQVSAQDVAVDSTGRAVITGGFATTATFAPGEANQTTLFAGFQGADVFVARYTANGSFEWARDAGPGTAGISIAVDGMSNTYVAGIFLLESTFGSGESTATTVTNLSPGYSDVFVAKYLNDTVSPNRAPVADPQAVIVPEDTPTGIVLTGSDPDGNQLTFSVVTGPAHGTLSGTAPNLTYTPHTNYHGLDELHVPSVTMALCSSDVGGHDRRGPGQ